MNFLNIFILILYDSILFIRSVHSQNMCLIELNCTFQGYRNSEVRCQETNLSMTTFPCQNEKTKSNILQLFLNNKNIGNLPSKILSKFRKLRILDLTNNQIEFIADNSFQKLTYLEQIFLGKNKITSINSFHFATNLRLKFLYLNNNLLSNIAEDAFINLSLRSAFFSENFLTSLDFLASATSIQTLSIDNNSFNFTIKNNLNEFYTIYQIWMGYNQIYTTNNIDLRWCIFITYLNLTRADLSEVSYDYFQHMNRLLTLDLSFNSISYIHNETFVTNCRLSELYLNNNKLSFLPNLQCMSQLKNLELQFNQIESINNLINGNTIKLQILLLNHNKIKTLKNIGLSKMQVLSHLDVSFNEIETLTDCGFEYLDYLSKLDISNNLIKSLVGVKFNMAYLDIVYVSLNKFNFTSILAIKDSIEPQVKKETVTKYYKTLFLNDRDYINCELSLYFIRYKIHFNLFTDNEVRFCLHELENKEYVKKIV